jgi:hypothetical protein
MAHLSVLLVFVYVMLLLKYWILCTCFNVVLLTVLVSVLCLIDINTEDFAQPIKALFYKIYSVSELFSDFCAVNCVSYPVIKLSWLSYGDVM